MHVCSIEIKNKTVKMFCEMFDKYLTLFPYEIYREKYDVKNIVIAKSFLNKLAENNFPNNESKEIGKLTFDMCKKMDELFLEYKKKEDVESHNKILKEILSMG